jgi:NTE family protein
MTGTRGGKTALVLAGGGFTGAVYEIGALRAIDDLLITRSVNDFDIFVGTSAGALVATFLANGASPEEMIKVLEGSHREVRSIERKDIFTFNYRNYLKWLLKLPSKLIESSVQNIDRLSELTLFDLGWNLLGALPSGLYDDLALDHYLSKTLEKLGQHNRFEELERELYIIATDLNTGERVIFGRGYETEVPISQAVAASSALPFVYRPVEIGEKEYIDGGLRGTASLDLAIEKGATLVVCINPLVPFDNLPEQSQYGKVKSKPARLSDKGIQSIANQSLRIFSHAGLHYHIKQLRRIHPEVDIILIEPDPKDYQMFFYNIMHYSSRLIVAQHGFESVTVNLAEDYHLYKEVLARHGIPISRRLVIEEVAEIVDSNYDPQVIRRVLEARSTRCSQRHQNTPICQLQRTLAELDLLLDQQEI